MSGKTRLRATLPNEHGESLDQAVDDRFDERAQAEREVVERGLQDLGYLEKPNEASQQLLWVVNRTGLGLGFVGLMAIGVGVFGPRIASIIGFGVTLTGLLLLIVEAALDKHTGRIRGDFS